MEYLKKLIGGILGEKLIHLIKNKIKLIKWYFNKPKLPQLENSRRLIHLCCGAVNHPDFINIDLNLHSHLHYRRNIEDLSIFQDNYADLIYISHGLEHISHRKTSGILKEWHRVLKPGGILRISVPDFDMMLKIYSDNSNNMGLILFPLMGGQEYPQNFHYNNFNERSLTDYLLSAGFSKVQKWHNGSGEYTSLPDWSGQKFEINGNNYPISLNIEGIK
jgi:predicted SAM-dependent methyltransferase